MIRHHDPVIQQVLFAVKMPERIRHHVRDFRPAQVTFAHALVEIPLHLAAQLAMNFPGLLAGCGGRELAQSLGMFTLEAQQHFFRQRVHEPEGHEVGSSFAFEVRKIATGVNAAAKWIGGLFGNPTRAQMEFHTFQALVGVVGVRELWITDLVNAGNFGVHIQSYATPTASR